MQHANENTVLGDFSDAAFTYVYAVALNSTGNRSLAIDVLQDAQIRFPQYSEILNALIAFYRDAGNGFAAHTYMNKLKISIKNR